MQRQLYSFDSFFILHIKLQPFKDESDEKLQSIISSKYDYTV